MTRYNFFKVMMVAMMAMVGANAFAQGRGPREMHFGNDGMRMEHRGGDRHYDAPRHEGYRHEGMRHEGPRHNDYYYADHHRGHMAPPPAPHPHFDRHGYLPGWEGRVRYLNGRYGYLRGSDWYWYDTYYAPDYYYAHPVAHFHAHRLSPEGRAIVTAVAGAAIIGGIISAIAH